MDNPLILLVIVFIVAPLIERLLKAGKGAEQPPATRPGQMPGQRMPQQRVPERMPGQREPAGSRLPPDEDAAADMLPDDLWEILTGERRPPRRPEPQEEEPEPLAGEYAADRYAVEDYPDDDESLEEMAAHERQSPGEWMSEPPPEPVVVVPDPYVRPLPKREVPRVVSLEDLDIDDEKRHEQFHDRLDTLGRPARVRRKAPNAYRFTSDDDLRKAIIMSEVLGTPKGLAAGLDTPKGLE
ncbi:MAG: hypothetical protein KFH98_01750 [Gemmatimonadetes bacterium]|nr:hypothetical protein [Gemmatimonadota bacterium]